MRVFFVTNQMFIFVYLRKQAISILALTFIFTILLLPTHIMLYRQNGIDPDFKRSIDQIDLLKILREEIRKGIRKFHHR